MKRSNFFGILMITFFCFFLQSNDSFAQRSRSNATIQKNSRTIQAVDISKLTVCKPNSYYSNFVNFAKVDPSHHVMAVNVTLVSVWNQFTGQAVSQLKYDAKSCSFVGNLEFRFSDRFFEMPNCNPPSGLYIPPKYPFNPKHLDKAQIRINATTGLVSLNLWGSKSFPTTVQKGIIHGFEKSANMMIAITAKKHEIPVIK